MLKSYVQYCSECLCAFSKVSSGCEKVQVLEFAVEMNLGNVICGKVAPAVLVPANRTGEIVCKHWDGDKHEGPWQSPWCLKYLAPWPRPIVSSS